MAQSRDDQVFAIRYLPPQFNPADIHQDNLKLLSDAEIKLLKEKLPLLRNDQVERYTKPELRTFGISHPKYGIIKQGDKLYAVYKGEETINGIKVSRRAGEGGFGVAKFVQDLDTGEFIIIKSINLDHASSMLNKEINNLKQANKLYFNLDYLKSKKLKARRINKSFKIIGMKIAEGKSLFDLKDDKLSDVQRHIIVNNMIAETKKVHQQFIHRDIKPENFICNPHTLKVEMIDYGLAEPIKANKLEFRDKGRVGTPLFMAPELSHPTSLGAGIIYNEATEVYALGLTIAEFLGLTKISGTNLQLSDKKEKTEVYRFLSRMLDQSPLQRPTMKQTEDFFKQIQLKEAKKSSPQVLLLDVDEFLKLHHKDRQKKISVIKAASKKISNIALVSSASRNTIDYWQISQILKEANLAPVLPVSFTVANVKMAEKAVNNYMKQSFQMNADVLELTVDNKIKYVTPPNEKHTFSKVMNTLASLPQKINPKKTLHLPHVEESQPQPSSAKPTNDQPTWKRGVPHHQPVTKTVSKPPELTNPPRRGRR